MRARILNQPVDVTSISELSQIARLALLSSQQLKIITLNPEMVINATKDIVFQAAINNSNLVIPDGTGIVWALKLNGCREAVRIPGIELAENTLNLANELFKKVAIFGGTKIVLEKIRIKFKEKYPNVEIVKAIDGYQSEENYNQIANEIALSKPDIIFVAVGSPKQEIWINKYSNLFPNSIMIGIGGSLDVWSGKKKRAPLWMRSAGLEWFYRVFTEPRRIPRVLKSLPVFVFLVLKGKLQSNSYAKQNWFSK